MEEQIASAPQNPFLGILTKPRKTIRAIVDSDPSNKVWVLIFLAPIMWRVAQAFIFPRESALVVNLLIAAVWCWVVAWVMTYLIKFVGERFGGTATRDEILAVIAWASIPMIINTIIQISLAYAIHNAATVINLNHAGIGPMVATLRHISVMFGSLFYCLQVVLAGVLLSEVEGYKSNIKGVLIYAVALLIFSVTLGFAESNIPYFKTIVGMGM